MGTDAGPAEPSAWARWSARVAGIVLALASFMVTGPLAMADSGGRVMPLPGALLIIGLVAGVAFALPQLFVTQRRVSLVLWSAFYAVVGVFFLVLLPNIRAC
jgi:hypothetical protein